MITLRQWQLLMCFGKDKVRFSSNIRPNGNSGKKQASQEELDALEGAKLIGFVGVTDVKGTPFKKEKKYVITRLGKQERREF